MTATIDRTLSEVAAPYSAILCDIWGVVHDGRSLFPGAAERLLDWKAQGKTIILVTNAPRPASSVRIGLDRVGLPRAAYDAITSSGEAGIAALANPARGVGFVGSVEDQADLIEHGVTLVTDGFTEVACTGFDARDAVAEYRDDFAEWAGRGVLMHCLNPDREVIHHGRREPCAGALADLYETLGGKVRWYGKPHAPIYRHALTLAGDPPLDRVLAIGDGLATDMLGAARFGIDAIFIAHGLHRGAPFPSDFAAQNALGDWRPLLTLANLS